MQVRRQLSCHVHVQVAAPAALGFATLFAGQVGGGLMLLGLAALGALAFYLWCESASWVFYLANPPFVEPRLGISEVRLYIVNGGKPVL